MLDKSFDATSFKLIPLMSEDGEVFNIMLSPNLLSEKEIKDIKKLINKEYDALLSGLYIPGPEEVDAFEDGRDSYFIWYVTENYGWEDVPFYTVVP